MVLDFIDRPVTVNYSVYPDRPIVGGFLHDTESLGPLRVDQSLGSWHWLIDRDGTIYCDVSEENAAWGVFATGHTSESIAKTRWYPPWLFRCPDSGVSDANYSGIHIEVVSHQQYRDQGVPFTDAQYESLALLIPDIHSRHSSIPWTGHGQVQTDRSDPVGLDWTRAGFGPFEMNWGYPWLGSPPEDDEEAMLTPDERDALQMLRDLSWNRESIERAVNRVGRAREIGQTVLHTKRVPATIKPLAAEMAAWD